VCIPLENIFPHPSIRPPASPREGDSAVPHLLHLFSSHCPLGPPMWSVLPGSGLLCPNFRLVLSFCKRPFPLGVAVRPHRRHLTWAPKCCRWVYVLPKRSFLPPGNSCWLIKQVSLLVVWYLLFPFFLVPGNLGGSPGSPGGDEPDFVRGPSFPVRLFFRTFKFFLGPSAIRIPSFCGGRLR